MTFKTGEILDDDIPADSQGYECLREFWLAPFAHVRPRSFFWWSPSANRVYYLPCGYDVRGDVTAECYKEEIERLLNKKWIKKVIARKSDGKVYPLGQYPTE